MFGLFLFFFFLRLLRLFNLLFGFVLFMGLPIVVDFSVRFIFDLILTEVFPGLKVFLLLDQLANYTCIMMFTFFRS